MRPISIEGFEKPKFVSTGAAPMLQWLKITDLVVDPAYQRPIIGKGRQNVDRIAREFSWSCFAQPFVRCEPHQRDHQRDQLARPGYSKARSVDKSIRTR
jgi:hypothetical protein